jgi:hypothetical protein
MSKPVTVSAESLRTCMVTKWTPEGRSEPEPMTDIRGTPIGDSAQVWEWDRLILRPNRARRTKEHVKVMHCPEGWYSTSGSTDQADEDFCNAFFDEQWNIPRGEKGRQFNEFHDGNPVVWVVETTYDRSRGRVSYCDRELPDEYRPAP